MWGTKKLLKPKKQINFERKKGSFSKLEMFPTRKNFGHEKNSERGSEKKDLTLNLEICGSPIPLYAHQPSTFRECKIYKYAPKQSKINDFPFPVDKIIYLTQKLELTSLTAKKIKSVSLSALDTATNKSLEEVETVGPCSQECAKKEEKRSKEVSSPEFNFSLDLSSIDDTADESDENCAEEEEEEALFHFNDETSNAQPAKKDLRESSRVPHCTNRSSSNSNKAHDFLLRDQRGELKQSSSCDLINIYINSVNNQQDLVKYFRPCFICKELCCICPDSSSRRDLCPVENAVTHLKNARDSPCSSNKTSRKGETEEGKTRFACECTSCPFLNRRLCCSEFCCRGIFETDLCTPFWGEECKFRNDPVSQRASDDSVSSDRILAYTSSLANAAKSARVLARDLELILSSFNSGTE